MFLILSFILLSLTEVFVQAAFDIPLIASDGTTSIPLAVGLDLTATNCIDPHLGEWNIPPIPPPGIFVIRFDLAPYGCGPVSTYKDYRPPGNPPAFPFTGMVEHTLWFQTSSPSLPIDITYNLPYGTLMTITDQIGGSFLNLGPFVGQGTATIPGTYTVIFSKAFLIMDYDNIIPVELTSFTAGLFGQAIILNWTTATETNNSGFEIQKQVGSMQSTVGNWETIGFVPGFGTTTEPKLYSFIDENVTTGTYKYRLKQIDFDGTFTYSNEIEVEVDFTPEEFVLYQNYPNPFNPTTTIDFALPEVANVALFIYNMPGEKVAELVNSSLQPGNYSYQWDGEKAASGLYFYELKTESVSGGFISIKKMMLLK